MLDDAAARRSPLDVAAARRSRRGAARRIARALALSAALAATVSLSACAGAGAGGADTGPLGSDGAATEGDALAGTVTVFAAASLTEVFEELATDFEERNPGVDVVLSFGGSSGLAEQIVQGAPADVFASADDTTMATIADAGLAADPQPFATNTLEIAVPAGNPAGVTDLADLGRPELAIALCEAEVPCGAASAAVLEAAGVTPAADTLEQDVKAVLTKVRLGEVDAGLVYRTDVLSAGDAVEGIAFDGADATANSYPVAALADAPNAEAADAFVAFVLGDEARAVLDDAGFGAP